MKRILAINTGGIGDLHGLRVRRLTANLPFDVEVYDVDRLRGRQYNLREIRRLLTTGNWDLVYQEATGIVGGVNVIRAAREWGQRYIVSTGDPVGGYFRNGRGAAAGWLAERYERSLYRNCVCFVGWTPYLAGMALQMGAPRAVTIEGAVDTNVFKPAGGSQNRIIRDRLGIPPTAIVCGVVGSIKWSARHRYCYGLELVRMLDHLKRPDVTILIVGDGDGMGRLREEAARHGDRVVFAGRVPETEVADLINVMDIGFITQTLDGLGNFRLTTKMPEYLAAGVPVAVSPIPGFFDYVLDAGWPLPACHPSSDEMFRGIAVWLDGLSRDEVESKARHARKIALERFDYAVIAPRFHALIDHLMAE